MELCEHARQNRLCHQNRLLSSVILQALLPMSLDPDLRSWIQHAGQGLLLPDFKDSHCWLSFCLEERGVPDAWVVSDSMVPVLVKFKIIQKLPLGRWQHWYLSILCGRPQEKTTGCCKVLTSASRSESAPAVSGLLSVSHWHPSLLPFFLVIPHLSSALLYVLQNASLYQNVVCAMCTVCHLSTPQRRDLFLTKLYVCSVGLSVGIQNVYV